MIKDKKTTIGYHCPYCGASILNKVDIFAMSNKLLKLKCVCGQSELVLQLTKDNKIRLTVPCIICPVTHTFTLSSPTFFDKDLFFLTCTFTAIGICFFGKGEKVINAMKENEEELIKMFKAYDESGDDDDEAEYTDGYKKVGAEDNDKKQDWDDDLFFIDDDDDDYEDDEEDEDDYFGDFDDDDLDDLVDEEAAEWGEFLEEFIDELENLGNPNTADNKWRKGFEIYKGGGEAEADEEDETLKVSTETMASLAQKAILDEIRIKSPVIFEQIMSIIYKLIEEKRVHCLCDDTKEFDGLMTIEEDKIILECKNCGANREIKAKTSMDLEYIYDMEELYLD